MKTDIKFDQSTHFDFGKNWSAYSETISEDDIDSAIEQLRHLLDLQTLKGKSFLDIGCGSGIHSLSALKLGAERIHAIDIDPNSVHTTRKVLDKYWKAGNYTVEQRNIFEIDQSSITQHDIVYSWGVLHHTGDTINILMVLPDENRH